jgi:hypothetical protein
MSSPNCTCRACQTGLSNPKAVFSGLIGTNEDKSVLNRHSRTVSFRLARHPTTSRYNDQQPHLPVDDFSAQGQPSTQEKVAAVCDFAA